MNVRSSLADLSILITGMSSTAIMSRSSGLNDDLINAVAAPSLTIAFTVIVWFIKHTYEQIRNDQKKHSAKLDDIFEILSGHGERIARVEAREQ